MSGGNSSTTAKRIGPWNNPLQDEVSTAPSSSNVLAHPSSVRILGWLMLFVFAAAAAIRRLFCLGPPSDRALGLYLPVVRGDGRSAALIGSGVIARWRQGWLLCQNFSGRSSLVEERARVLEPHCSIVRPFLPVKGYMARRPFVPTIVVDEPRCGPVRAPSGPARYAGS